MQAQSLELRDELGAARVGKVQRHGARLGLQFDQHLVDGLLPEGDAAFERGVHLDVEPGFDRARDELHRHGVDDEPGEHGECREAQKKAQREPRAEDPRAIAPRHDQQLIANHAGEENGKRGVQREQQGILLGKERRIAAGRGQQEKPDRGHGAADDQQKLHRSPVRGSRLSTGAGSWRGECTTKRFHGESSCRSRLVNALSWNGLGNNVGSRRMRTAAS